jgi:hypothetical protein
MAMNGRRKLLTAAVGVATVSYIVACEGLVGDGGETSGNLVAPVIGGSGGAETSGNLVAPVVTGGSGGVGGSGNMPPPTSGNLPAPPPPTGGSGGAGGSEDAGTAAQDSGSVAPPLDASADVPDSSS